MGEDLKSCLQNYEADERITISWFATSDEEKYASCEKSFSGGLL